MNLPTEFKWMNDSLTSKLQQNLVRVLAKHFRIPEKQLRAGIDTEQMEANQVLSFNAPGCPPEDFYVANCPKLGLKDFLTLKAFEKSKFVAEKAIFDGVPNRQGARFVVATPSFWVQASIHEISNSAKEGGGIYMNYPSFKDEMLVPLDLYLNIRYPSPSH